MKAFGLNTDSIAIGRFAGSESFVERTIAIGRNAGVTNQSMYAVAIGDEAGQATQGEYAIAVGGQAGEESQGENAISIGAQAGNKTQGKYAIAIGAQAGVESQPEYSIIISSSETPIEAKKKGLYVDPIRKFDDREGRPVTVKEGNILSYNYKNDTTEATKEVVTGFPRLPGYPTDAEVALAITLTAEDAGTMYFDTTKKKVKIYNGTKWVALADEEDLAKLKAAAAAAAGAGSRGSYVTGSDAGDPQGGFTSVGGSGAYAPVLYMPDGSKAREGYDYYLEYVPGLGSVGPPVFYKDINVANVETPPDGRPGFKTTTYDNGHVINEQIPVEQWNPPLAAWNNLPSDERRGIAQEYAEARGYDVMLGGDSGGVDKPNTFESDQFRSFLEQKGLG